MTSPGSIWPCRGALPGAEVAVDRLRRARPHRPRPNGAAHEPTTMGAPVRAVHRHVLVGAARTARGQPTASVPRRASADHVPHRADFTTCPHTAVRRAVNRVAGVGRAGRDGRGQRPGVCVGPRTGTRIGTSRRAVPVRARFAPEPPRPTVGSTWRSATTSAVRTPSPRRSPRRARPSPLSASSPASAAAGCTYGSALGHQDGIEQHPGRSRRSPITGRGSRPSHTDPSAGVRTAGPRCHRWLPAAPLG